VTAIAAMLPPIARTRGAACPNWDSSVLQTEPKSKT
jgi:hypothetical protein